MATTHVNRRHERFTQGALEKAAVDSNAAGGIPQLINHDWSRINGWTNRMWVEPVDDGEYALHFEALMPETADEEASLNDKFRDHVMEMQKREIEPYIESIRSLGRHEARAVFVFDCVGLVEDGLAAAICPETAKSDDEGLVPISRLDSIARGLFLVGDHILAPHWMMRRYGFLLNSLNDGLIGILKTVDEETELSCRVRIDPNFVGLRESVKDFGECDYWWGPPFKGDLRTHPEGVLCHGSSEKLRLLEMLNRTEMYLYRRNDETIVQIEEIHQPPIVRSYEDSSHVMERYAHMVVNQEGRVVHLDGAVRLYSPEKWEGRQDPSVNMANAPEAQHRLKMFAVDGSADQQTALGIISAYFRGNPLVSEIFGLEMNEAVA